MSTGLSSNFSFIRRAFATKRVTANETGMMSTHQHTWRDYALIFLPYLWMVLFFLLPFLIIFKISLSVSEIAIPPYSPLVTFEEGAMQIILHLENYTYIFTDPEGTYIRSYLKSLQVATFSTFFCLLIGYPIAWALATARPAMRNVLFMLIIMPSWTSFVVRIYAWMTLLKRDGLINEILMTLGIIDAPIQILQTDAAVYIGIVYCYLPYMVLPLFSALMKVDYSLIEAASDLGCRPVKTFFNSLVPQTKSGIVAGSMLVFIPAIGEYVIPELLGGKGSILIGRILWQEFFNNRDWPLASAVAIIMLIILVIPIVVFYKIERKEQERINARK
ncbi:MAG: ABC transporter permease subunit [Anaerobiospirillum succiniciproducens]|nr:ABC transporter permease subunit [Anaerobiospirillum succiniciproducens]MDY2798401.1 ABC transporter permease subunit [Anaerobiospirillum succiniciproducens]